MAFIGDSGYPEVKIQMKVDIITESSHGGLLFTQSVNSGGDDPAIYQPPQIPKEWLETSPQTRAIGQGTTPMIQWPESESQSNSNTSGKQYADPSVSLDTSVSSNKRAKKHRHKDKHGRKHRRNEADQEADTSFELSQKSDDVEPRIKPNLPLDTSPYYFNDEPTTSIHKRPHNLPGAVPVLPPVEPMSRPRRHKPTIVEVPQSEPEQEPRTPPLADIDEFLPGRVVLNTFEEPSDKYERSHDDYIKSGQASKPIVELAPDTSFEGHDDDEPSKAVVSKQFQSDTPQVFVNETTTTTTTVEVFQTVFEGDEPPKIPHGPGQFALPANLDPTRTFHDSQTRRSMETLINDPAFPQPAQRRAITQKPKSPIPPVEQVLPDPTYTNQPKVPTRTPPKPKLRLSKTNVTSVAPELKSDIVEHESLPRLSQSGFETVLDDPAPVYSQKAKRLSQNTPVIMEIPPLGRSKIVSVDFAPTEPLVSQMPSQLPQQNRVRLAGLKSSSSSQDRSYDSLPSSEGNTGGYTSMPSNKIFEMYTNKLAPKSDSSGKSPSPTPLSAQHPVNLSDNSIDDEGSGVFPVEPAPKRDIYTIPESPGADTTGLQPNGYVMGQTDTISSFGSSRQRSREGTIVKQAVIKYNPSTSSIRSRSSIDSERSSLSGVRQMGAYRTMDMGSEMDNLSDYLQGRLTPIGPEMAQPESVQSTESLISETSLRNDNSYQMYDDQNPPNASYKEPSFGDIMQKQIHGMVYGRTFNGQTMNGRIETQQSNTSISSFGSVRQEPTRYAEVVRRETMETNANSQYGEAKTGSVTLLTDQMREMLAREEQSLRDKKSAITTSL